MSLLPVCVFALYIASVACRIDPILPKTTKVSMLTPSKSDKLTDTIFHVEDLKLNGNVVRMRAGSQMRQITTQKAVAFGAILAFNSGVVNGLCLSGALHPTKQASAAVTGAWTNSALGAASGNHDQFVFNGKCILSYFFGSFLSGVLNPNPKPFEISVESFRYAFWCGSALLLTSSIMAGNSKYGRDFFFLIAMTNGLQNSLTSTTTANLVRSAHFSGITSDMGTFVGQVLRGNYQNLEKLKVFLKLALSFWGGGFASYYLIENLGNHTLWLSAGLYLVLGLAVGVV